MTLIVNATDVPYELSLGDLGPALTIQLDFDGSPFVLDPVNDTVVMTYIAPYLQNGNQVTRTVPCTITNAPQGLIQRAWVTGDLPVTGTYTAKVQIQRKNDSTFPRTFPADGSNIAWVINPAIGPILPPIAQYINVNASSLIQCQAVYQTTTGHINLALGVAAPSARAIGLIYDTTIAANVAGNIQSTGVFTAPTSSWDAVTGQTGGLTIGAAYYLSASVPGRIAPGFQTGNGDAVTYIGTAQSTTSLLLGIQAPIFLTGPQLVVLMGDSNMDGHGATFFVDDGLKFDPAAAPLPYPIPYVAQYSNNPTDPITWTNLGTFAQPVALQPYAPYGSLNMGPELSMGRTLDAGGMYPYMAKLAVDSTSIGTHWLPTSSYLADTGANLYQQSVNLIRQAVISSGRPLGAIFWINFNDALTQPNANNYQANLTTLRQQWATDLGTFKFVYTQGPLGDPTDLVPYRDIVRTAQASYAVANPGDSMIGTDDCPTDLDNTQSAGPLHWRGSSQVTIGNRAGYQVLDAIKPPSAANPNLWPTLLGYDQVMYDVASTLTPRWGGVLPYQIGDLGLLVALSWFQSGTITVSDSAWTPVASQVNSALGSLTLSMACWWQRATSVSMPAPTVTCPGVANMAGIFIIRGAAPTGNPIEIISPYASNAQVTSMSITGGTTAGVNRLIFVPLAMEVGAPTPITMPTNIVCTGLTDLALVRDGVQNISGNDVKMDLITGVASTAGAFGPLTATITGFNSIIASMLLAIKGP